MVTEADIAAVDAFLSDQKHLYGAPPEFGPTNRHSRKLRQEWDAVWPIADSLGVVTTGQLRFVARPVYPGRISISVIFNRQSVGRLDFVSADECEFNPLWAAEFGLLPKVCGPHFHAWEHNRGHVLRVSEWELPCREQLPPQIRKFSQAFPWLAARINLGLTPDQRQFDPPQGLL
jgi:hypothetical protein